MDKNLKIPVRTISSGVEQLSQRQTSILKSVVETHIETSQPVGSRAIVERYSYSFSPATVRNEMGYLEEVGYLMHPHTSAGRIPTDHGYRYYLDHTAFEEPMPRGSCEKISEELSVGTPEEGVELFLDRVSLLLSSMSQEIGLMLMPLRASRSKLSFQGVTHMLEKPEFQDLRKVKTLFGALEEKEALSNCLLRRIGESPVSIAIGHEHGQEALEDCAIVTARYQDGRHGSGAIAILGPKRMAYRRIIPMVSQMAVLVGDILEQIEWEG
ncbi:MAG TPA: hypothetical protein PLL75_06145 [Candidatus Omnitrophota bacterium]|nr:hypothetical protein [Candidatus Omnitrophota bacterium]HPS37290.1 hypothetical protein [Candidatus Omnitrophota bacterium]